MDEKVKNILEWVYCIVIALILALLFRYYVATPTIVQMRSMFPTLKQGQRLILNRTFRITNKKPEVGDIVTFEAPSDYYNVANTDQNNPVARYETEPKGFISRFNYYTLEVTKKSFIKRVIATEGQHVVIKNNTVTIDGNVLNESSYLQSDVVTDPKVFNDFIVPEGYYFCMGDNRTKSTDCRDFGCIPGDKIEGIVAFSFWPLNTWGKIK